MIESGLLDYWRAKYGGTTGPEGCNRENTKLQANSVGLEHLSGNFLILPVGLGISSFFLFLEIAWKHAKPWVILKLSYPIGMITPEQHVASSRQ